MTSPTVCRAHNGDIHLGFRRMPNRLKDEGRWNMHIDTESHVALMTSQDCGNTWSAPRTVEATPGVGQQAAQLTTLSDGRILLGSFRRAAMDAEEEGDIGGPMCSRGATIAKSRKTRGRGFSK